MSLLCKPCNIDTLNDALDLWLCDVALRVKRSTCATYTRTAERHLRPLLGSVALRDFSHEHIALFLRYLNDGDLSPATARLAASVLRSVLQYAQQRGTLAVLPSFSAPRAARTEMRALSEHEQLRLRQLLNSKLHDRKRVTALRALAVLLCLHTGMRLGEVCALRWADFSQDFSHIIIKRTVSRITQNTQNARTALILDAPKSLRSNRRIPVPLPLREHLRALKADAVPFLLSDSPSAPEPRTLQRAFKSFLKEANVPDINFHALRHTFATNCVSAGCDLSALARILGHSDVAITLNTYVHTSLDGISELMDSLAV